MDPAQPPPLDAWAEVYEALVDWPKRLGHETPFYRRWFQRVGTRRVLDAACGTGHHAAMFRYWGLDVQAADLSPAMIEAARRRHGQGPRLDWRVRAFDAPVDSPGHFDAVICTGNSLALVADPAAVRRSVSAMLAALRPGGCLVLHALNLWRLSDGPCVWQKCVRARLADGESVIVKGVHRAGSRGYVNLVVTTLQEPPVLRTESVPFLGLEAEDLEIAVRDGGAARVALFGGYDDQSYVRDTSVDLVLVAETS